jgi:beta-1,4-mannosyl-glycoprotein beta-1,4-N-acetylglucosaminyltransferase
VRIFDTFAFDGELSLLEHRLAESYDLVDFFVVVEARRTYRNDPKPLLFDEHRARFQWAHDRIRWVALDTLGGPALAPRERAAIQRNGILFALRDALPDDIVLLLDADEIPSRSLLMRLRRDGLQAPSRLAMTRHYEFLNVVAPASTCCPRSGAAFPVDLAAPMPGSWQFLSETWHGRSSVAVHFSDLSGDPGANLAGRTPFAMRFDSGIVAGIEDAGRHLTAVDPAARLDCKLKRVFHEEHAGDRGVSLPHLQRCRRYGIHHRGWWYGQIPTGALPEDLERLASRHPQMLRSQRLPAMILRRMMRSWAWLRTWSGWSTHLVLWMDRHFGVLLPLLAVPLLLADALRALLVRQRTQRMDDATVTAAADHRHALLTDHKAAG